MNSRDIDDGTAIFLGNDQKAGIVVDEEKGEVLRLESEDGDITFDQVDLVYHIHQNEPVNLTDLEEEYDATERRISECLHELFERGEIYEPQPNEIKIVPDS